MTLFGKIFIKIETLAAHDAASATPSKNLEEKFKKKNIKKNIYFFNNILDPARRGILGKNKFFPGRFVVQPSAANGQ